MAGGGVNNVYEMREDYSMPDKSIEDNFFFQMKQSGQNAGRFIKSGDFLWDWYYSDIMDFSFKIQYGIPLENERFEDRKSIDNFRAEIERNPDFRIGLIHLTAVDGAAHHYDGYQIKEVQEDIALYDKLVREVIEMLDENTTLLVFGDHGMDW